VIIHWLGDMFDPARAGVRGLSPWRDKVAECGLDKAARLIRRHGLAVTGYCRAGLFPVPDKAQRLERLEDNRRAVDEAAALGAECLIVLARGLPPRSKDIAGARRQVEDGLAALLEHARTARLALALEPLHPMYAADRACVNTLAQALDLCDRLGDGLGVAIDVYHLWWDPNLARDIARAGPRILAFHICDWLVPTTDLLLDRGMMGDGVIDIRAIRAMVEEAGYRGFCEAEIFSKENWWRRPAEEVVATCRERFRTCC
jgi:sugar phosphate isomerase/epimerase